MRFSLENDNFESSELEKEAKNLLRQLKIRYLEEKQQQVGNLIKESEKRGEDDTKLIQEHYLISKKLEEAKNSPL